MASFTMCYPVPLAISRASSFSEANSLTRSVIGPAFFSAEGADNRPSLDGTTTLHSLACWYENLRLTPKVQLSNFFDDKAENSLARDSIGLRAFGSIILEPSNAFEICGSAGREKRLEISLRPNKASFYASISVYISRSHDNHTKPKVNYDHTTWVSAFLQERVSNSKRRKMWNLIDAKTVEAALAAIVTVKKWYLINSSYSRVPIRL